MSIWDPKRVSLGTPATAPALWIRRARENVGPETNPDTAKTYIADSTSHAESTENRPDKRVCSIELKNNRYHVG